MLVYFKSPSALHHGCRSRFLGRLSFERAVLCWYRWYRVRSVSNLFKLSIHLSEVYCISTVRRTKDYSAAHWWNIFYHFFIAWLLHNKKPAKTLKSLRAISAMLPTLWYVIFKRLSRLLEVFFCFAYIFFICHMGMLWSFALSLWHRECVNLQQTCFL